LGNNQSRLAQTALQSFARRLALALDGATYALELIGMRIATGHKTQERSKGLL
jgi:hypothetical protein